MVENAQGDWARSHCGALWADQSEIHQRYLVSVGNRLDWTQDRLQKDSSCVPRDICCASCSMERRSLDEETGMGEYCIVDSVPCPYATC